MDASQLLLDQELRRKCLFTNFETEYKKCINHITYVTQHCSETEIIYTITDIDNLLHERMNYVKKKLRDSNFYVKTLQPGHFLYISWKKENVKKVKHTVVKKEVQEYKEEEEEETKEIEPIKDKIEFVPSSGISNVHLRSVLMLSNPKFSHLKSYKKLQKKRGI